MFGLGRKGRENELMREMKKLDNIESDIQTIEKLNVIQERKQHLRDQKKKYREMKTQPAREFFAKVKKGIEENKKKTAKRNKTKMRYMIKEQPKNKGGPFNGGTFSGGPF